MKIASIFFTALLLLLSANSAAADRTIQVEPGLWEYTHTLEIPGLLSPITRPKTECVSAGDARRNLSDLLGGLSGEAGCTISNLKDNLNTVKFDMTCSPNLGSKSLHTDGHLEFRYGRTAISGSATGVISIGGAEIAVNALGYAQRIGRCNE